MEETKNATESTVEEKVQEAKEPARQVLTYEQLRDAAMQLQQQLHRSNQENNLLRTRIQEVERAEQLQYLGFAFKVVEYGNQFSPSFVEKTKKFIETALDVSQAIEASGDQSETKLDAETLLEESKS